MGRSVQLCCERFSLRLSDVTGSVFSVRAIDNLCGEKVDDRVNRTVEFIVELVKIRDNILHISLFRTCFFLKPSSHFVFVFLPLYSEYGIQLVFCFFSRIAQSIVSVPARKRLSIKIGRQFNPGSAAPAANSSPGIELCV